MKEFIDKNVEVRNEHFLVLVSRAKNFHVFIKQLTNYRAFVSLVRPSQTVRDLNLNARKALPAKQGNC